MGSGEGICTVVAYFRILEKDFCGRIGECQSEKQVCRRDVIRNNSNGLAISPSSFFLLLYDPNLRLILICVASSLLQMCDAKGVIQESQPFLFFTLAKYSLFMTASCL